MKRVLLVLGSFAAVTLTLALLVALAAAIMLVASVPQNTGTRPTLHRDLISLNHGD